MGGEGVDFWVNGGSNGSAKFVQGSIQNLSKILDEIIMKRN